MKKQSHDSKFEIRNGMDRRTFIKNLGILGAGMTFLPLGCVLKPGQAPGRKVILLGIDGMDTHMTKQFMLKGLLPNFSRLARMGGFVSMGSSMPPQSPVAWSDLAVGATAAVHGIYDFIHRDPATMAPYLSTSRVTAPEKTISVGKWDLPMKSGKTELLRKGKPFWDYLAERDIPTTISRLPGNFPSEKTRANLVSGMGTPDLRGGYGSFTLFTTSPETFPQHITGGVVEKVRFQNGFVETNLAGPQNSLQQGSPVVNVPIKIWRDRENPVVRIQVQDQEFVLKKGEWTQWIRINFPMIPHLNEAGGICRLFIKSVHPEFHMYVSPININPEDPVLPIFSSDKYGSDLVNHVGPFYTQGLPDDTKALSYGILNEDEYLTLAHYILSEQKKMLDFELEKFDSLKSGMLFFYISSVDQNTHMYWRAVDKAHPMYNEELHQKYGMELKKLYVEMDHILGKVMDQFDVTKPSNTLLVMSDHGFAPFRRQVNLNTWLYENGFLSLTNSEGLESEGFFEHVDWSSTAAYALGINSLYLNIKGREPFGVLPKAQAPRMLENIRQALLESADTKNGEKFVSDVFIVPEDQFKENPHAPDMIIGWKLGYRCSWEGILGGFSPEIVRDNDDKWSGDHCIDPRWVPAILLSNRPLPAAPLTLHDITATILGEFEIQVPGHMIGRPIFSLS